MLSVLLGLPQKLHAWTLWLFTKVLPKSHFLKNSLGHCSPLYLPRQASNKLGWSKLTFNATSVPASSEKTQLQYHKEVPDHCLQKPLQTWKERVHALTVIRLYPLCMATGIKAYQWKWGLNTLQVFYREQLLLSKRSSFYCPFLYEVFFLLNL